MGGIQRQQGPAGRGHKRTAGGNAGQQPPKRGRSLDAEELQ